MAATSMVRPVSDPYAWIAEVEAELSRAPEGLLVVDRGDGQVAFFIGSPRRMEAFGVRKPAARLTRKQRLDRAAARKANRSAGRRR